MINLDTNYLTYMYLLSPLHTGGSADEGNLMGIAREVHTELPYIPASSLRGRIRSELESQDNYKEVAGRFFGQKIKDGQQPTEGEVWFSDASLLLFPVASYSHQFLWITCPLWLSRWNRWLNNKDLNTLIEEWRSILTDNQNPIKAISPIIGQEIYLQGAKISAAERALIPNDASCWSAFSTLPNGNGILNLMQKLIVLSDLDCSTLVEMGLQREVRIAIEEKTKTAKTGSFRSEETIPSETVLFFPWGIKLAKKYLVDSSKMDEAARKKAEEEITKKVEEDKLIREEISKNILNRKLQFGGLEGLGRGFADCKTISNN